MPTIGIIGHLDLRPDDIGRLEAALRDWWSKYSDRRDGGATLLLTSLASGADQLAAWVFQQSGGDSVSLHVVHPYSISDYVSAVHSQEQDDDASGGRWSFDSLAEKAVHFPLHPDRQPSEEKDKEKKGIDTAACYRDAGQYIAETADVLVALWDGVRSGRMGGTSDTLLYAISQACQSTRDQSGRAPLDVQWLVTPRKRNPFPAGEAFTWQTMSVSAPVELVLRPRFRRWQVALPAGFAAASVVCSWIGYGWSLSAGNEASIAAYFDSVLAAVGHLTLNSLDNPITGAGAGLIRMGRWLAVVFALTTIASLMNALFSWVDRVGRSWVVAYKHDVICGVGWRGRQLIVDSVQDPTRTIAVEIRPDDATRDLCASAHVPLIEGDAADAHLIRRIGVSTLRSVFVVCDSDDTNMRVVHELAQVLGPERVVCCVGLQAEEGFHILRNALPVRENLKRTLDLRVFNTESVTARMLLEALPLDRFAAPPDPCGAEVVLLGDSPMAGALLRHVLQQGIFEEPKGLSVACISADPAEACRAFTASYPVFSCVGPSVSGDPWRAKPEPPWLAERVLPCVQFLALPKSDRQLLDLFEGGALLQPGRWSTTVIVAHQVTSDSASTAYALAQRLEDIRRAGNGRDIVLACYYNTPEDVYRADIERSLNRDFAELPIQVFSDFLGDCSKQAVRGDTVDRVARRINGVYSKVGKPNRPGQRTLLEFDGKCEEIWGDVSEEDKESNRLAAAHLYVKRRIVARMRAKGKQAAAIEDDLALVEHRRWCAEYLLRGFRPLVRNPRRKTPEDEQNLRLWFARDGKKPFKRSKRHLDLVPIGEFEELHGHDRSLEEKAKDRLRVEDLEWLLR